MVCSRAAVAAHLIDLLLSTRKLNELSSSLWHLAHTTNSFQLSSWSWAPSCLKTSPSSSITFCPYSCPANSSLLESGWGCCRYQSWESLVRTYGPLLCNDGTRNLTGGSIIQILLNIGERKKMEIFRRILPVSLLCLEEKKEQSTF